MNEQKYIVWFVGNEDEPSGICFDGRHPFVTNDKDAAESYAKHLAQHSNLSEDGFKVYALKEEQ